MSKRFRIVGINFDHFHMGDLLRNIFEHPDAEIAGICDETPERMRDAQREFAIPADRVFTDYRECLEKTKPHLVVLCPAAATHGLWTKRVAEYDVHLLVEKPFAGSLAEADEMIAAQAKTGKLLAINWPSRWAGNYMEAKKLIDAGIIGTVTNVHYYGGNRGPLFHGADKQEKHPTAEEKAASWFYKKSTGGGSMLDYLGYGTTMGTWFHGGRKPIEVTAVTDEPPGLEVDEHSITVARYDVGLSKFETRWGTFTDPWTLQPSRRQDSSSVGRRGRSALTITRSAFACRRRRIPSGESGQPIRRCPRTRIRFSTCCTSSMAANSRSARCTRRSPASASRSSIARC